MQRTLCLMKPDAVQRRIIGRIVTRFEEKGLRIDGLKMLQLDRQLAEQLYEPHVGKDFYEPLVRFVCSGPVVAVALSGPDAIQAVRKMVGATWGLEAEPGSIRGDYAISRRHNVVHASDGEDSARRELSVLFAEGELLEYERVDRPWVSEKP